MRKLITTAVCACFAITAAAADKPASAVPDLTKGGKLTRINKRWVGPVGIYCGSWRPRHRSDDQKYVRQLLVLQVDKGSPADGILAEGDVILGADGSGAAKVPLFKSAEWAMIPIAEAITKAEARDPALLKLLIWRPIIDKKQGDSADRKQSPVKRPTLDDINLDAGGGNTLGGWTPSPKKKPKKTVDPKVKAKIEGKIQTVTIKLESLGTYSDTAPYNCPKSKRILEKGVKALYESDDPGKFSLGILCLLAADDPRNPDNAKYQAKAKEWARRLIVPSAEEVRASPWQAGYHLIILSEYYMKTKDKAVFPTIAKYAELFAKGQSWFGTTGHRWCEKRPDGSGNGRIAGYGPINASAVAGFLGLSLAREAGVKSPRVDAAIKRADIYFAHFAFKGGIGYGEMPYAIGGHADDNNGKHATAALALGLQAGREEKSKYFMRMAALSSHQSRQYAHGGPFFGQVWQPLGAGLGGDKVAAVQFKEIRWHLDLKRRPDGSIIYDPTNNKYGGFCYAANTLLTYALPLKNLYITGRGQKKSLRLNDAEFNELLATDKFDPAKATTQELIAALSRSQGLLRTPAGQELARRTSEAPDSAEWPGLLDKLLALAADDKASPTGRAGACYSLMVIKNLNRKKRTKVGEMKDAECAKTLVGLLKDPNPYIRFAGVRGLQSLNPEAVRPHVDAILDAVVATGHPTFPLREGDPLQWAHGEMGVLLFQNVLNKSIDGVDRAKLLPAIRSLLGTPNASGRMWTSRGLAKLTREETLEVADVIVDNVMVPPPGNAMGGTPAPNSQAVLAKYMFEEALPLSAIYGASDAIKNKIPQKYGRSALNMHSAREFLQSLGDQILVKGVDAQGVVDGIKNGEVPEKLYKLKRIDAIKAADTTLTLPAAKTELILDATNFGRRGANETTYTWRKVYGAGKVNFTPNVSGQSKKTTVAFTDKKPGKYRFEVTMSDTLGLSVLRKTVDVTLYDKRGKLPGNKPPQAKSQSLQAVPGLPVRVGLSGTDPDGDDLGFVVTQQPAHGTLSGVGGELFYTANYGHNGTDRFTFQALDGQGKTAAAAVDFKVSDQNVGVAVYEGFDYPEGAVLGRAGGTSFGFKGRWKNSKSTKDWYLVAGGSLSYAGLPSTGGKLTKGKGWWPCSRSLDPNILSAHKLLSNGRELWFSVIIQAAGGKSKFSFGLRGGNVEGITDLGFLIDGWSLMAAKDGKKAGTSRIGWSRTKNVMFSEKTPHMIIGRCAWGKTDKDTDTLEIYRVFDAPGIGPMVLEEPVCVIKDVIPQAVIRTVYMRDTTNALDEIRIGPTLHSVMMGTKPLSEAAGKGEIK